MQALRLCQLKFARHLIALFTHVDKMCDAVIKLNYYTRAQFPTQAYRPAIAIELSNQTRKSVI